MKKWIAMFVASALIISMTACFSGKSGGLDTELLGKYDYIDEDSELSSTVVLNEDGTFVFTFSPLSSYVGNGKYTVKDDVLTLTTDDGKYHYVFKMEDGTLIFDAEKSSEELWFGQFSDGSVFE